MGFEIEKTVAARVALSLRRHGVEYIFGQSLPSAVILAAEQLGIRQIAYRQENMGGAMADGYARCSGRVGVVAAQNGPAATLLVPPLAEAMKASIPIVALVQEVERDQTDRNAFQELDHMGLFQACSKWVRKVSHASRIDDYIDMAFSAATSGRAGPVVLLLPADLLREEDVAPAFTRDANLGTWPLDGTRPSDEAIARAASLIAEAKCPIVIAGGGVHAGGQAELALLQEVASLPVFTTNMGKGVVDEHHPLSGGVMTMVGQGSLGRHTRKILEGADLIVLIGTRTNQNGTDSWRLLPREARIVHIDVDPVEIGRNYEAIRLVGDARTTLVALNKAIVEQNLTLRATSRHQMEEELRAAWAMFERDRHAVKTSPLTPIRPERVMAELQSSLTPHTTVVADASYSSMWIAGQLRALRHGMRFISPRGLAGLGWGLPLAIGAKVAAPEHPVVVIVGDGGFAHSWAEMETLVRCDIPLTIVVLNNGILGFQKHAETVKFGNYTTACAFSPVDHCLIAKACGCDAVRVKDPADLGPLFQTTGSRERPLLIEVETDPDAYPPLTLFESLRGAA